MARRITEIIEQQVRRWSQQPTVYTKGPLTRSQRPMITISSAYGSNGAEIAKMAAEQLDFDLFDRELVDLIAGSGKVRELVVDSLDDRRQNLISEYVTGPFSTNAFTSTDYLGHLCRVVLTIGQHGRAVLLGRGAQFILDPRITLRVRTVAPLDMRISRIATQQELSADDARAEVLRCDADRQAFCRLHFDRDVADPLAYDLVINTAVCRPEQAAVIISQVFETRFGEGRSAAL